MPDHASAIRIKYVALHSQALQKITEMLRRTQQAMKRAERRLLGTLPQETEGALYRARLETTEALSLLEKDAEEARLSYLRLLDLGTVPTPPSQG